MKVLVMAQEPDTNASTCCSAAAIRAAARRTVPSAERGALRNEPTLRRAITNQAPSEASVKKGFEPMPPRNWHPAHFYHVFLGLRAGCTDLLCLWHMDAH